MGTYKKDYGHGFAAHVIILSGKGYSLTWLEGSPMKRFDGYEYAIVVPLDMFHPHFNAGKAYALRDSTLGEQKAKDGEGPIGSGKCEKRRARSSTKTRIQ